MSYHQLSVSKTQLEKESFLQKAFADYNKIIEINSSFATGYMLRGWIYGEQAKFDLAIADLSKAISLEPNTVVFYEQRANVYRVWAMRLRE